MPITPNWVFNFSVSPEHADLIGVTPTTSMAEVMALMGKCVISGPVDIDWTDRYGWTEMTFDHMRQFIDEGKVASDNAMRQAGLL